jgi:hypothetical protein
MSQAWRWWAVLVSLAIAVFSFFKGVGLGVTGEEGLKYNPDPSRHLAHQHMQIVGDLWMQAASFFLLVTIAVAASTIFGRPQSR